MLRGAVSPSFNMLSVDSDTSTSDTCAILANGLAGAVDNRELARALAAGCIRMTEMLARDGEGAQHLVRVIVRGAASDTDARRVAKSVVNSPLVKTMVHGADPNVGRLLMAVGKCIGLHRAPGYDRRVDQRASGRSQRTARFVRREHGSRHAAHRGRGPRGLTRRRRLEGDGVRLRL